MQADAKTWGSIGVITLVVLGGVVAPRAAQGRSLQDALSDLLDPAKVQVETPNHTAHFSSSSAATFGLLVQQVAAESGDFQAVSTTPSFTYRYNPDLGALERSSGSLGSIFAERANTIGKGRFDLGFSYLYENLTSLDGQDLQGLTLTLKHQDITDDPAAAVYDKDTVSVVFDRFDLTSHILSFFGTYGITDQWDVNVLIPLIVTTLTVDAHAQINNASGIHFFDQDKLTTRKSLGHIDEQQTGVGDILLRTKYRFTLDAPIDVAGGLTLRLPTGDEANFQGIGDFTLTPYLVASKAIGKHDLHASLGFEANPENKDRSRARYALGATIGLVDRVAFLVDLLGNSGLSKETITKGNVPQYGTTLATSNTQTGTTTVSRSFRNDIVDLAFGLKVTPVENGVLYASVIVPLTSDGLRADYIPSVGVQWGF